MAGQVKLCFAFLLVFHFSLVSCRNDYYHYYSRYVKGESSTESGPSSTTGTSTSESAHLSTPEVHFAENVISAKENSYSSSNNDAHERRPTTLMQYSYNNDNQGQMRYVIIIRWGLTIGGIIVVGLIVCCVSIFCPCCCRGKERRGYIIGTNVPDQTTTHLIQPQISQAVAVQHFPPETQPPQQPPPYNTQPIQHPSTEHLLQQNPMQPVGYQQFQQPPMFQDHNPAVAPPPYPTKY